MLYILLSSLDVLSTTVEYIYSLEFFNTVPESRHAVMSLKDINAFTSNKPDDSYHKSVFR
jgi:hypothetical protein